MPELDADTAVRLTWRLGGRNGAHAGRLADVKAHELALRERGAVLMRIHTADRTHHAADVRLAAGANNAR